MSTNVPSRINLGANTKVSLHDRFTKLSKAKLAASSHEPRSSQGVHVASSKNRALALQMAERPTVQAALKLKAANKKLSLNQRLGGARFDSARIGKATPVQRQGPPQRPNPAIVQKHLENQRPNRMANKMAIQRVGPKGGIGLKNRIKFLKNSNLKQRLQKPQVKSALIKKKQVGKAAAPKAVTPVKSKESLDMDLDSYMKKSKNVLDNDLDAYMAQAP